MDPQTAIFAAYLRSPAVYKCPQDRSLIRVPGVGQFPHAERIGRSIATLPLFPAMADSDVDRVCAAAAKALK